MSHGTTRAVNFVEGVAEESLPSLDDVLALKSGDVICKPPSLEIPSTLWTAVGTICCLEQSTGGCYNGECERIVLPSGTVCTGTICQGHLHGKVKFAFADDVHADVVCNETKLSGLGMLGFGEARYHGELCNGLQHGQGVLEVLSTGALYEGGVLATLSTSAVLLSRACVAIYKGQFCGGLRHGHGTFNIPGANTQTYVGAWSRDQKHGFGTMTYASGDMYEGHWRQDKKEGFGTAVWSAAQERYQGQWHNGVQHGVGEHVWFGGLQPGHSTHASVVRCNRYVGTMKKGFRDGEGVMLYASGSRYEGQWQSDCKHGSGVFLFEDGSTWRGLWEHDQPVTTGSLCAFAPAGAHPQLHVEDLLEHERDAEQSRKGLANVFMSHNSEMRQLYDRYAALDLSWFHSGDYVRQLEARPSFGLLSMQVWQMMHDAGLISLNVPLTHINKALSAACAPPADIAAHRSAASVGEQCTGVWTLDVPLHSPFRELTYPEFCSTLTRLAQARFCDLPSLGARVQKLITGHLQPLLLPSRGQCAVSAFLSEPATSQYLQSIDIVLRLTFCAISSMSKASGFHASNAQLPALGSHATPRASVVQRVSGLLLTPDLQGVGARLAAMPHPTQTRLLDDVPKQGTDSCTIKIRQLTCALQQAGFVTADSGKPSKGISLGPTLQAIRLACFPGDNTGCANGAKCLEEHLLSQIDANTPLRAADAFVASVHLTYYDFVLACVGLAQIAITKEQPPLAKLRALVDGPRGLMAEVLRATGTGLPPEAVENFSYLVASGSGGKGSKAGRRSRRSSIGSKCASSVCSEVDEGKLDDVAAAEAAA